MRNVSRELELQKESPVVDAWSGRIWIVTTAVSESAQASANFNDSEKEKIVADEYGWKSSGLRRNSCFSG